MGKQYGILNIAGSWREGFNLCADVNRVEAASAGSIFCMLDGAYAVD